MIPAFFAIFWAKDNLFGDTKNEIECLALLFALISRCKAGSLPSSYYSLEEVTEFQYKHYLGKSWHEIDNDNQKNVGQFARIVHALAAKRNWKQSCKLSWPDITRIVETSTRLDDPNEVGFPRVENATQDDYIVKIPQTWERLIADILSTPNPKLPKKLLDDLPLLLLLLIFLPYRANFETIMYLDRKFGVCWYK